jgi:hypothetical protein
MQGSIAINAEQVPCALRQHFGVHRVRGFLEHGNASEYVSQTMIVLSGELHRSHHPVYRVIDTRARLAWISQVAMRHDGRSRLVHEPFDPLAYSIRYASKLKSRHSSSTGLDFGDR